MDPKMHDDRTAHISPKPPGRIPNVNVVQSLLWWVAEDLQLHLWIRGRIELAEAVYSSKSDNGW